jgi:hypothetical protein
MYEVEFGDGTTASVDLLVRGFSTYAGNRQALVGKVVKVDGITKNLSYALNPRLDSNQNWNQISEI